MNESRLRELISEATVDCYGEIEEFWGFLAILGDELDFPFRATVLGDPITVISIADDASTPQRGIMIALKKKGETYTFPLSEIDVSELKGDTAAWVAAYQLWSS